VITEILAGKEEKQARASRQNCTKTANRFGIEMNFPKIFGIPQTLL
jgi:predicted DsbA family dithiol-disulfide isomerase